MRNKILILITFLGVFFCTSCSDDTAKPTVKSAPAPNELQAPSASPYVLTLDQKQNTFEIFKWTPIDFGFPASVTYTVQIDVASNNFHSAIAVASSNTLDAAITVGDMNTKLLDLGLIPEEAADIDIRIASSVVDNGPLGYSNVRTITVTPYATSFPSIYAMGDAWQGNGIEVPSSVFKKYETLALFTNGTTFQLFEQRDLGAPSFNYPFFTTVDPLLENSNDDNASFKFIGTTGWYKINLDFKTKTIVMATVDEPVLYMTGAALNGWNWDPGTPVKMNFVKPGVFEATATFKVQTFRFFAQADWGPASYNYPFFTSVDSKFENANDGDKNLKFTGTPGSYKITVDLNAKAVTMN